MHNIEILFANKSVLIKEDFDMFTGIIDSGAIDAVNIHPINLINYMAIIPEDVKIYLSLDLPYSRNTTEARVLLLKYYLNKYQNILEGINIGLLNNDYNNENTKRDLERIVDVCNEYDVECRVFVDILIYNDTILKEICQTIDQSSASAILLGTSVRSEPVSTVFDLLLSVYNDTSIPIGMYGNFEDCDLEDFARAHCITMLPENILDLFPD